MRVLQTLKRLNEAKHNRFSILLIGCIEFFPAADTGLLLFFVSKCLMSIPWYVELLVLTAEGTHTELRAQAFSVLLYCI